MSSQSPPLGSSSGKEIIRHHVDRLLALLGEEDLSDTEEDQTYLQQCMEVLFTGKSRPFCYHLEQLKNDIDDLMDDSSEISRVIEIIEDLVSYYYPS